jgi:excisionase family DNA binding protein
MPERMLTLADVAEILDITVPTARSLVRQGEIQGFQVGGRGMWRVESKELDAYIDREKAAAAARRTASQRD